MQHRTKFRHLLTGLLPILLCVLAAGGLLLGAQPASAQNCIGDRFLAATGGHLVCTANDVRIAAVNSVTDVNGNPITQCIAGSTFSFLANFEVLLGAQARYDIGLYFATDADPNADGALTGTCAVNIITQEKEVDANGNPAPQNFINLDLPANGGSQPTDTCGDIDAAHNPQFVRVRIDNATCADLNNDGFMDLPNCTSWRQPGSNQVCTNALDAYPGSPSKCNCGTLQLPVRVETGGLAVTKDSSPASLPEPGGEFTYTVGVTNTLQFTTVILDRICDDRFGLIVKVASAPACPAGTIGTINSTTCVVPQTLAPQGVAPQYSCTFKANVNGEPQMVTDTVTVYGHDQGTTNPRTGSDSAQVSITDVPPTAQVIKSLVGLACADVDYHVRVHSTDTAESLTLSALTDNTFGSITSVHDAVLSTTCSVPQTIAASGNYECDFRAHFCGGSHTDTVTGTLDDNDPSSPALNQDSNSLTVNVNATVGP